MAAQTMEPGTQKADIDRFLQNLQYDPRVLLAVQSEGSTESLPVTTRTQSASGDGVIVVTKRSCALRKNLSDVAILRPTAGAVFPGALVRADTNLMDGQPTPIGLERAPVTISVDLPGLVNARRTVANPSNSSVQDAITEMLEEWNRVPQSQGYINPARSYLDVQSIYNSQQAALELGFNAKWATGNASAQLSASTSAETSSVLAYFKQVFYTVAMDTPIRPSAVFADSISLDDVRGTVDPKSPPSYVPAYVRSVDYGRILMIKMESSSRASQADLKAALQQATAGGTQFSADMAAKFSDIRKSSRFTVVAIGGGAQTAANFSGSDEDLKKLRDYILKDAAYRRDNPGAPISYNVAFLKDNQLATMGFTTDYTQTDSVVYPNGYVKLRHSGAYVGSFRVDWEEPDANGQYQPRSWSSGDQTAGYTHQINLPGDARKVNLRAWAATGLIWDPWGEAMNVTLNGPNNKCYRIGGTTLDRWWDNNC
jgi:thiol-activated cytolysin